METYKFCFVAYLDILGFKMLVERNSIEDLNKIFEKFIGEVVNARIKDYNGKGSQFDLRILNKEDEHNIKSVFISDSIILWTTNPSFVGFFKLLALVNDLLFNSFLHGTPLRGAIAAGELSTYRTDNNTTVFGSALVKAYNTSENQNWAGCILDKSVTDAAEHWDEILGDNSIKYKDLFGRSFNLLTKYWVPLKFGNAEELCAVNWIQDQFISSDLQEIVWRAFASHNKHDKDWKVLALIKNTGDFFNQMISNRTL